MSPWRPYLRRDTHHLKCRRGLSGVSFGQRLARLSFPSLAARRQQADLVTTFTPFFVAEPPSLLTGSSPLCRRLGPEVVPSMSPSLPPLRCHQCGEASLWSKLVSFIDSAPFPALRKTLLEQMWSCIVPLLNLGPQLPAKTCIDCLF